jgi:hypothetical protein
LKPQSSTLSTEVLSVQSLIQAFNQPKSNESLLQPSSKSNSNLVVRNDQKSSKEASQLNSQQRSNQDIKLTALPALNVGPQQAKQGSQLVAQQLKETSKEKPVKQEIEQTKKNRAAQPANSQNEKTDDNQAAKEIKILFTKKTAQQTIGANSLKTVEKTVLLEVSNIAGQENIHHISKQAQHVKVEANQQTNDQAALVTSEPINMKSTKEDIRQPQKQSLNTSQFDLSNKGK